MRSLFLPALAATALLSMAGAAGAQAFDRYGGGVDYSAQATAQGGTTPQRVSYTQPRGPAPLAGGRFLSWAGKSDGVSAPSAAPVLAGAPAPFAPPRPVQVREAARGYPAGRVETRPRQPRPAEPVPAPARIAEASAPASNAPAPVTQAPRQAQPPRRPWTEWRRAAPPPQPAPVAAPSASDGWAPFDPAALARGDQPRAKPRQTASTARRTIYDATPASQAPSPAPAPVRTPAPAPASLAQTGSGAGGSGMRHYSLHREFGMKPDPTPIPPQFFTATADLSAEPAGPDPVVGTGKTAAATRARVAAQSDPS